MSSQTDFEVSDFVFYVDELEDDFTFYVSAASNDDYIKALKKVAESNSTAEAAGERFSFSEQITFTNLIPNEKSPGIGDGFFEQFSKPSPGLAAKYLLALLEQAKASETDAELITNLQNRSLTDEEEKSFAPLLVKALKLVDPADREWTADLQLSSEDQKLRTQLEAEPGLQRKLTRFLLERAFPNLEWQRKKGRALICFSHARKALSITVRKLDEQVGYEPSRLEDVDQKNREKYLFSVAEYCAPIYEQVFTETESTEKAQGLLVITGPTKSLKSEITRGLIHLYLTQRAKKGRRPHLVTFEDPIERFYSDAAKDGFTGPSRVALALRDEPYYVNYTARQKEKDASFLRDALTDALRQTPAVFFVGETRDKREWEVLLDFASTGHLVVLESEQICG